MNLSQFDSWLLHGYERLITFIEENPPTGKAMPLLNSIMQLNAFRSSTEQKEEVNISDLLINTLEILTTAMLIRYQKYGQLDQHTILQLKSCSRRLVQLSKGLRQ